MIGEDLFIGLVSGFEVELGYFSLKELRGAKGPLGLQIEQDLHYEPWIQVVSATVRSKNTS